MPAPAAPPSPKSRTGLYAVIGVVVVVVVVLGALAAAGTFSPKTSSGGGGGGGGGSPSATVDITPVNLDPTAETSTCWTSSTGSGGTVTAGDHFSTTWTMSYSGGFLQPASCTVQSVSVATPGFSIVSSNTPVVVSAGGTQTLTIVLGTPATAYTGTVTIDATVTAP